MRKPRSNYYAYYYYYYSYYYSYYYHYYYHHYHHHHHHLNELRSQGSTLQCGVGEDDGEYGIGEKRVPIREEGRIRFILRS
jgi:hypothetical protein